MLFLAFYDFMSSFNEIVYSIIKEWFLFFFFSFHYSLWVIIMWCLSNYGWCSVVGHISFLQANTPELQFFFLIRSKTDESFSCNNNTMRSVLATFIIPSREMLPTTCLWGTGYSEWENFSTSAFLQRVSAHYQVKNLIEKFSRILTFLLVANLSIHSPMKSHFDIVVLSSILQGLCLSIDSMNKLLPFNIFNFLQHKERCCFGEDNVKPLLYIPQDVMVIHM